MVEKIEIDVEKLLKTFSKESTRLLEEAEEAFEGGKEHYQLCILLCQHLVFVRITCITNNISMPKWYERDEQRLRIMYGWQRDLTSKLKPKYILFAW